MTFKTGTQIPTPTASPHRLAMVKHSICGSLKTHSKLTETFRLYKISSVLCNNNNHLTASFPGQPG